MCIFTAGRGRDDFNSRVLVIGTRVASGRDGVRGHGDRIKPFPGHCPGRVSANVTTADLLPAAKHCQRNDPIIIIRVHYLYEIYRVGARCYFI